MTTSILGASFILSEMFQSYHNFLSGQTVKIVNHLTILTYLFIMFAMIVTSWFWCERKLCTNTAPISKLSLYAHVNLCVNRCTQENGIIVIGSCNSTFSNLLSTLIYHLPRLDGSLRHIRLYEFTNADEIVWN